MSKRRSKLRPTAPSIILLGVLLTSVLVCAIVGSTGTLGSFPVVVGSSEDRAKASNKSPTGWWAGVGYRRAIKNYLNQHERSYTIERWYPSEPVDRGEYRHGVDYIWWVSANNLGLVTLTDEDLKELEPYEKRIEQARDAVSVVEEEFSTAVRRHDAKVGGRMLIIGPEVQSLRRESRAINERYRVDFKDTGRAVGAANSARDEKIQALKRRRRQRIGPGCAIRVEYTTDEGFDRIAHHDTVFILNGNKEVVETVPSFNFRIVKPGDL